MTENKIEIDTGTSFKNVHFILLNIGFIIYSLDLKIWPKVVFYLYTVIDSCGQSHDKRGERGI